MFSFASGARGETSPYCLTESLESSRTESIRFLQHAILSNTTAMFKETSSYYVATTELKVTPLKLLYYQTFFWNLA